MAWQTGVSGQRSLDARSTAVFLLKPLLLNYLSLNISLGESMANNRCFMWESGLAKTLIHRGACVVSEWQMSMHVPCDLWAVHDRATPYIGENSGHLLWATWPLPKI